MEVGVAAQGRDQHGEQAHGAGSGVGEIDDLVAGGFESCGGGPGCHRLAGANLPGEDAEAAFVDQPGESGHGLLMGGGAEQGGWGKVTAEGHAGEAVIGAETIDTHGASSSVVAP